VTGLGGSDPLTALPAALARDVAALGARFDEDPAHSRRVAAHAGRLLSGCVEAFDHPERRVHYATVLTIAALVHDVGRAVAAQGHERHGRYLVRHAAETAGWDPELRELVAALTQSHRRRARRRWLGRRFGGVEDHLRLAALLRIADGLDRAHDDGVRLRSMERWRGAWRLSVSGLAPADADRLRERKADLFPLAFGEPLVVRSVREGADG
jgi:exopolyphosphatase/guanosine-5'-triphosphate,3'-diphosphate pyrophosphatase